MQSTRKPSSNVVLTPTAVFSVFSAAAPAKATKNPNKHATDSWVERIVSPAAADAAQDVARTRLLARLTCRARQSEGRASPCIALRHGFSAAVVYLHGFPDMSVDPAPLPGTAGAGAEATPDFASRFPRKLSEAVCAASPDTLFVCFNASGLPGSDAAASATAGGQPNGEGGVRFQEKTVSRDVLDAVAVLRWLRAAGGGEALLAAGAPIHVVGLSTGAIIVGMLRGLARGAPGGSGKAPALVRRGLLAGCTWHDDRLTLTAVAGLVDTAAGVELDFDGAQREACWGRSCFSGAPGAAPPRGWCWKEFWLPAGYLHPDADLEEGSEVAPARSGSGSYQCRLRLGRQYLDEFVDGTLDVAASVGPPPAGGSSAPMAATAGAATEWAAPPTWAQDAAPLLVIHGTSDKSVPLPHGLALFEAAAEPKRLFTIKGANHLLSSGTHIKKACQEVLALMERAHRAVGTQTRL